MTNPTQVRNIYNLRVAQRLTLGDLAARLRDHDPAAAVGRTMLTEFENGNHFTSQRTLEALAEILEAPIEEIIRMVEIPEKVRGHQLRGKARSLA